MLAPVLINKYISAIPDDVMSSIVKMNTNNLMVDISILSVIIFALANIILPFINKQLTVK
jgi:hypothetical protein